MSAASWLALAALLALLAFVATWLHYRYWVGRFTLELPYELEEVLPTEDGSSVELRRLPPSLDRGRDGPPVLLVHGVALNHRNHDLSEDLSLGRYLAQRGRDVWLLTLRSGRDRQSRAELRRASFERMARYDVPLGVREVLGRTGSERLDYVGYSMGGMLLYAAVGRFVDPAQLRKVVVIGSPARIQPPLAILSKIARLVPGWIVPTVPLRLLSRLIAFAVEGLPIPFRRWIYNSENVESGVAALALVNGFVDIPGCLAEEFLRWAADGGAVRYEDREVTETLRPMAVPALFVAGAGDRLAPPETVRLAYQAWGADVAAVDKSMRIAGVEHGAAADYGHGDLAVGRFAELDVFEPVAGFLDDVAGEGEPEPRST